MKSTPVNDQEFFAVVDEYWASENSKKLQLVLKPTSKDKSVIAANRDEIIDAEMMKGAYAFPHSVPDSKSEILNIMMEGKIDKSALNEIVSFLIPIRYTFLTICLKCSSMPLSWLP